MSSEEEDSDSETFGGSGKPKVRSQPFTTVELNFFLELVNTHKQTIGSTKTDFDSIGKKKRAWEAVLLEYNANPFVRKRSVDQLKKKWDNAKSTAKKEVANHARRMKKRARRTSLSPLSQETETICAIVSSHKTPLDTDFDCDVYSNTQQPDSDPNVHIERKQTLGLTTTSEDEVGHVTTNNYVPVQTKLQMMKERVSKTGLLGGDQRSRSEDDEHRLRLQALHVSIQLEEERLRQAQQQTIFQKEEQTLRLELLRRQIANTSRK